MLKRHNPFWAILTCTMLTSAACTVEQSDDDDPNGQVSDDDDDDDDDDDSSDLDAGAADDDDDAVDDDAVDDDDTADDDAGTLVEVPDLTGLTIAEATEQLDALGLELGDITEMEADGGAAGIVLGQSVAAGEEVRAGTAIDVVATPTWDEERISDELDLPVYPDEDEVDETVEGIDENGDGARDDVERDLGLKYWPDRDLIAIIDELIRTDQGMIVGIDDPDAISDGLERKKLALGCLESHFDGDLLRALEITGDVAAHMFDTEARLAASRAVESKLGGQVVTLPTAPEVEEFCQGLYTPDLAVGASEAGAQNENACVAESKTVVTYSNSIFTRHDKALINAMALRQLARAGDGDDDAFVYKLAFNDSDGLYGASGNTDEYGEFAALGDFIGQASAERLEGFNHYQSGPLGIPEWIKASLESSDVLSDPANVVDDGDAQRQSVAYSSDGTVGNRVFLFGHGLGHLYANAAHAKVTESQPNLAQAVRVIGVGTPSDTVAGDADPFSRYVTLEEDVVVSETMAGLFENTLAANATNETAMEPSGHEFLQSYVNGGAARDALSALLADAIENVEAPEAIGTDGIITVTLTWGEQPDIDLHAFEPDGTHVFYQSLTGPTGALDVDDTSQFGPEHFTVSCDSLVTGTYGIGVNYFRGDAPETATINIVAGSQSRTFTIELPEERSTAGDNSPIPIADIEVDEGDRAGTFVFQIVSQLE